MTLPPPPTDAELAALQTVTRLALYGDWEAIRDLLADSADARSGIAKSYVAGFADPRLDALAKQTLDTFAKRRRSQMTLLENGDDDT